MVEILTFILTLTQTLLLLKQHQLKSPALILKDMHLDLQRDVDQRLRPKLALVLLETLDLTRLMLAQLILIYSLSSKPSHY